MTQRLDKDTEDALLNGVATNFQFRGTKMAVKFGDSANKFAYTNDRPAPAPEGSGLKRGILKWGTDNKLPDQIRKYVEASEIVGKALEFLIDTAYGDGIMPCTIQKDDDGNKTYHPYDLTGDARDFFELSNPNQYLKNALTNVFYFKRAYAEISMDKQAKDRKAILLTCKDTSFGRVEEADASGNIERFIYYGSWGYKTPSKEDVVVMPLLDMDLPKRDFLTRTGKLAGKDGKQKDDKEPRYIYPLSILTPGRREYPQPAWWSIFTSGWYDFMQAIPQYKKALMKNQMMVKYIIYIDKEYFKELCREEGITDDKEKRARVNKELTNLNEFLTNTENVGKSFIGRITYNPTGNSDTGRKSITIEVLPNNFKGGEYLEDSQEVSKIIGTSLGVNLNMIGDIPGKTGALSGSDIRERFIILNALMKPIRDLVLEPLYAIKKQNGWPDNLDFTIANMQLTTLDKNTGAKKNIGPPTA